MGMTPINFTVFLNPKAQGRPRKGKHGNMYSPNAKDKEDFIALSRGFRPDKPWGGAIKLDVTFGMPIPKSLRRKRTRGVLHGDWHTKKPDRDNLLKLVQDAMKTAGFYTEDCKVCTGDTSKIYADTPGIQISMSKLE